MISKGNDSNISTRHYRVEVLLHNFITEDMQFMLRPLNLIQSILLYSKYQIKDNFITSHSFKYTAFIMCDGDIFNDGHLP